MEGFGARLGFVVAKMLYLKYDIHTQEKIDPSGQSIYKANYANWADLGPFHVMIPVNTEVEIRKWRRGFFSQ